MKKPRPSRPAKPLRPAPSLHAVRGGIELDGIPAGRVMSAEGGHPTAEWRETRAELAGGRGVAAVRSLDRVAAV